MMYVNSLYCDWIYFLLTPYCSRNQHWMLNHHISNFNHGIYDASYPYFRIANLLIKYFHYFFLAIIQYLY